MPAYTDMKTFLSEPLTSDIMKLVNKCQVLIRRWHTKCLCIFVLLTATRSMHHESKLQQQDQSSLQNDLLSCLRVKSYTTTVLSLDRLINVMHAKVGFGKHVQVIGLCILTLLNATKHIHHEMEVQQQECHSASSGRQAISMLLFMLSYLGFMLVITETIFCPTGWAYSPDEYVTVNYYRPTTHNNKLDDARNAQMSADRMLFAEK